MFSNLRLAKFKKSVSRSVFGELQLTQISLNFKTSCYNVKIIGLGAKLCVAFLLLSKKKKTQNYDVLKSKNSCILLSKIKNINKNKTESKVENPTHRMNTQDEPYAAAHIRIEN